MTGSEYFPGGLGEWTTPPGRRSTSRAARRSRRRRSRRRRTTTRPTRPAMSRSSAGSTSRPTTSTAAGSARSAARRPGTWRCGTSPARPVTSRLDRADRCAPGGGWLVAGGRRRGSLAALGAWSVVAVLLGPTPPTAHGPPRFVEEADAAGIDHTYDGDFRSSSGAASPSFDCDDDGRPDLYFAGGTEPAALYRNESPVGGRAAVRAGRGSGDGADRGGGRVSRSTSTATAPTDLAVLRFGENVLLRGLGDCRFERANEALGRSTAGNAWTTAFSATWEGDASLPTLAFGNYLELDAGGDGRPAPTTSWSGPSDGTSAYARSDPARARLVHALDPVQRLGSAPAVRDLRVTNDRQYYVDGRGAAVADRGRARLRACTRPTRAGSTCEIWGMGIAQLRRHRRRLPEVYLTSQADNKLQTLTAGPGATELPGHRAQSAGSSRTSRTREATRCRPPPGIPSSRT